MENENNFIEGEKVENNRNTYKTVREISSNSTKGSFHFGKQVVVPFFSGVLGAGVVVASVFGIPSVRENLLSSNIKTNN